MLAKYFGFFSKNDPSSPSTERRSKSPSRRAKDKIRDMESDTELEEVCLICVLRIDFTYIMIHVSA